MFEERLILLTLLSILPACQSEIDDVENNDLPADVDFERDFIDRLNFIYNKTILEEQLLPRMIEDTRPKIQRTTDSKFLFNFAKEIANAGVNDLKNEADTIRKIMKIQPNELECPKEIIAAYANAIKQKYRYTVENYMETFDMESILLNFVDETSEELFTKKFLLLKHYMVYDHGTLSAKWNKINEILNFDLKEQKHTALQELCYERDVCKYYPGFTDFMADFLDDIIALPAATFHVFMLAINQLVRERMNFFETVIYDIDYNMLSVVMDHLQTGDVNAAKEILRIVRNFVKDKFKLIKTNDPTLKTKTKAIRMLMEIIDKVFEKDGSELLRITFGNLRSALRHHAQGNNAEMTKVLADFLKHSLITCESQWGEESREEVKVLVEAALRGSCLINPELLKELFKFGSQYLQRAPVDLFML